MADFDFPADLLELQCRWYLVDARCVDVSASLPPARDVVAGIAEASPEQEDELAAVRAERLAVAEALQGHGWWRTVEAKHRLAAKAALREVARQRQDA
jgi:hypothetical protein